MKDGNTLEQSEILEPLHTCLRELLELDRKGKGHTLEYTDEDVAAATLMYSHILGNRLIHKMTNEKVSIGMSQELAHNYGEQLKWLTKVMSDVDLTEMYRD